MMLATTAGLPNEIIVACIAAVSAGIPTYFGYWRSKGMDEATKQEAKETGHTAHMSTVVDGLESVIRALQEDNLIGREEITKLRAARRLVDEAKGRVAEIENGRS